MTQPTNNMQTENIKDENQLTISESKHRSFMEFESLTLPNISELMTELLLKGESEEAVFAAVKTAARGYSTFYNTFMSHGKENSNASENEKATIEVYKTSPHIWAGGLEGKALANWLISRANAILKYEQIQQKIRSLSAEVENSANESTLLKAYSELGVYSQESSPTQPLSREAIQYDISLPCDPDAPGYHSQTLVVPMHCPRYSQLPDLREAERKYQETRSALLSRPDPVRDWFSKK